MPTALPPLQRDLTADPSDRHNQHWVPEAYLRQWRDRDTPQGAYVLTCPNDLSAAPTRRSAKRIFTAPDMNTMTKDGERNLRLESIYHAMETSFGAVRERVLSGTQATTDDIVTVVSFVAAQMVRTPKFRSYWCLIGQETREAQLSESILDHIVV